MGARDAVRARWRREGWYSELTIGHAIARAARECPSSRIVFAPADGVTREMTVAELHAGAMTVAAKLAMVAPGDAVVLQAPADAASTEVVVALWSLGARVVPLATTSTPEETAHAIRQTGARHAVLTASWRGRELAAPIAAGQRDLGLDAVIVLDGDAPPGAIPLGSLADASPTARTVDPQAVACVLYTSGSTAAPKGVRHSHETLLCGLTAVPGDGHTRTLATFPAGHVAALLGLLRPLCAGGTTVVMDRWSARAAAELVEAYQLTVSAGTPFFLSTLLDEAERSGRDISSLVGFLVGAAPVPPALVARAEAAGIVTWRTYGSTEQPAISAGSPLDPPDKRRLTDGRVAPGNEVRLVDERGAEVPPGDEGEILARGPKQFLGYQDPTLDVDAFVDSTWFRTGDLGRFDDDGYLVVTDRAKDIIIRGGENISAREVEEVLASHPAIAEVAVCAASDPLWGESVCAVVVVRPGAPAPMVADLAGHAERGGLAQHKWPSRMIVVDALPRTAAGKVRKRDLRPLIAARSEAGV